MIERLPRDAYSAGFRDPFEARRDVHAIAVDILTVDNDIAEMEANAELHPFSSRTQCCLTLNLCCAQSRFNDAAELDQDAVAHQLDDAAVMLGNRRLDQFRTLRL